MKLKDVLENVVAFPVEKRRRKINMDKLRKKSTLYDEITGMPTRKHPQFYDYFPELRGVEEPGEYWLVNDTGKAFAVFDTEEEAKKMKPQIEMKHGARGLNIVPMN